MAERVFDRLAKWTRLDDEKLAEDILAAGAPPPTRADLERARKLFARVIETPGGLKIQTIHAFCERVLHLFPFEANVPAGFRPLDEREAALLREQSQARLFAGTDPELGAVIARVAGLVGADGFGPLIAETARLGEALTIHGTAGGIRRQARRAAGARRRARTRPRSPRPCARAAAGGRSGGNGRGRSIKARPTIRRWRRS